jgi:hypothetical protein
MSIQPSTHDEILATWLEEHGDLEMVLFKHKLSPAQLRAFVADPIVIATMDAHESLLARRRRILASMHMQNAAEMLSKSMFESSSLVESRRAATSLARLTRDMTRNASTGPAGGGGRVREAGGGASNPKETPAPAVAPPSPLPLPDTLHGAKCPQGGAKSSMDPHPTTPAPITRTTHHREPGRVAPESSSNPHHTQLAPPRDPPAETPPLQLPDRGEATGPRRNLRRKPRIPSDRHAPPSTLPQEDRSTSTIHVQPPDGFER